MLPPAKPFPLPQDLVESILKQLPETTQCQRHRRLPRIALTCKACYFFFLKQLRVPGAVVAETRYLYDVLTNESRTQSYIQRIRSFAVLALAEPRQALDALFYILRYPGERHPKELGGYLFEFLPFLLSRTPIRWTREQVASLPTLELQAAVERVVGTYTRERTPKARELVLQLASSSICVC